MFGTFIVLPLLLGFRSSWVRSSGVLLYMNKHSGSLHVSSTYRTNRCVIASSTCIRNSIANPVQVSRLCLSYLQGRLSHHLTFHCHSSFALYLCPCTYIYFLRFLYVHVLPSPTSSDFLSFHHYFFSICAPSPLYSFSMCRWQVVYSWTCAMVWVNFQSRI